MGLMLVDAFGYPLWMWLSFLVLVLVLLGLDLGVINRGRRDIGFRESLYLSAFYISIGIAFSLWIGYALGRDAAFDYLTGFVVEKSLAMDNIFVIAMIFGYFAIPRPYQHKLLIYGIAGVIVLRGIMIGAGAAAVMRFEWLLDVFAFFLVFTGFRLMISGDKQYDPGSNILLRWVYRHFRVTEALHDGKLVVRLPDAGGKLKYHLTPLFLALVMVETADVIFAVDSIPAIFAITTDPYVVYTSNIFAILGLRALYFALAPLLQRFRYLSQALALILVFIGAKVLTSSLLGLESIPAWISLCVTLSILAGGVVYSVWRDHRDRTAAGKAAERPQ
ncbi:TerC/Alx family metal homeostasis membrane protein [Hoeflea sp. WL0058]|uniref:TerC/Alx family metal homeostasis membrane protein n=2 Tax=Flavimaribacter sediminis TaxID=2865987 RepID=A0AAE2ZPB2_9HYPH|nr:TerC/Alx family metal homeostasis membrane protein [Flavimaribacter sediminis]